MLCPLEFVGPDGIPYILNIIPDTSHALFYKNYKYSQPATYAPVSRKIMTPLKKDSPVIIYW